MVYSKAIKLTVIVIALAAGAAAATFAKLSHRPDGVIADGVRVAGHDLSNKPATQARGELEEWRKSHLREPLELALAPETRVTKHWSPARTELGAELDVEAMMTAATSARADEGAFTRLVSWFAGRKTVDIPAKWKFDTAKLQRYLKKHVAASVERKPRNARFHATKDGFSVEPEQPGVALDVEGAAAQVQERVASISHEPIILPTRVAQPHVTAEDLKGIEGEIGGYRTHYSERGNRAKNIMVACSHIDGTVLKPGDRFSYNEVVGPREAEQGFKLAPVIIRGKLQPGMGGGVCQVSSTLYNAALLADLKIVRREHHAFPVHYLPAGRDATVAYGSIDFQFENNTGHVIAIGSDGTGGQVQMRIFGVKTPGREVSIDRTGVSSWGPSVQTVHDSSLPAGAHHTVDSGHAGHRVTVWRTVKINGQVVKREAVSHDYYQAFPRVVAVGSGAPRTPRAVPTGAPAAQPAPPAQPLPGGPPATP